MAIGHGFTPGTPGVFLVYVYTKLAVLLATVSIARHCAARESVASGAGHRLDVTRLDELTPALCF